MKGKKIILFLVSIFLVSLLPYNITNIVSAISITYPIGFESGVSGNPYSDSLLTTKKYYGNHFYVNTNYKRSGGKAFIVGIDSLAGIGWFNFTYSKSSFLTGFKMYVDDVSAGDYYFNFYNETLGLSTSIVKLRYYIASNGVCFWYETSVQHTLFSNTEPTGIFYGLGFNILNSLGAINYLWGKTAFSNTTSGFANSCPSIDSSYRIDRLYISGSGASGGSAFSIDDINITISDSYNTTSGGGSCTYISDYAKIGIDNTPYSASIEGYQLFKIYNVYTNGIVKGVSLCVNPTQYSFDPNPNNYTCKILGFPESVADCFYLDGFNYRLFWGCNIDLGLPIPNQQSGYLLYAQFFHRTLLWGNTHWVVCVGGTTTSDLDSDGDIFFKYQDTEEVPQNIYTRDLGVSFYLTKESTIPTTVLSDSLGLQNWVSKNTTGYLYTLGQPEGLVCSYILGSSSYIYKIEVNLNGSLWKTYNNLNFPSGVVGFIPLVSGRYDFKLYSFHYVYNITAYVSGTLPTNFFLASDPLFTNPYESYNIYYKFYHTQGFNGLIGTFLDHDISSDFTQAINSWSFSNNQTNTIPYDSSALTNEYLTLFVDHTPYSAVYHTTHYINNPTIGGSWDLYVSRDTLPITRGNPEGLFIDIKGHHPFSASDVGIYIDGIKRYDLRETQIFDVTFTPHDNSAHQYNISLEIRQNSGLVVLKTVYFTVSITGQGGGGGIIGNGSVYYIAPPVSYIVGAVIIVVLTMLPIIITKGQGGLALGFVSFILAIVGLVIDILFGYFPAWSIAVVIALGIIIILIMWLQRKTNA